MDGVTSMDAQGTDQLSAVFAALADPTRREILLRLQNGDASVSELAEPFAMSQPAISKHLKVLESAGLVSRSRVATTRLSHLEAEPLREATEWMQRYKRFWNASFDRLDAAIAAFQENERRHEPGSETGREPEEEEETA
ncbi:ArsR/SmtB family transcription factor [Leifsonia sp. NPDC102414]|uniref:ArsR/SmtB family transcription factor n=1 Tax=unclassified Leifsonia TaxID=2663824 RepID=UPI000A8D06F0|nr:metalloregulator ArsR/SmtB family transcription factor [Leifsonia sp. Root227]